MSYESDKALTARYYMEVLTEKRLSVIDEIYADSKRVAEGDLVVTRWSADGTHLGDFMGHPGSGRRVRVQAIHIHKITNNRIAVLWEEIDLLGLGKQLGIVI